MTSASTAPVQYMIATSRESVTLFLQNMSPAHAKMAAAAGIGASLFVWCAVCIGSSPAKKKCKKKVGSTKGGPNGNGGQKSATVAKTKGRKKTPPSREKSPSATQAARKRSLKADMYQTKAAFVCNYRVPDSLYQYGLLSTGLVQCGFSEYVELFTKTGRLNVVPFLLSAPRSLDIRCTLSGHLQVWTKRHASRFYPLVSTARSIGTSCSQAICSM